MMKSRKGLAKTAHVVGIGPGDALDEHDDGADVEDVLDGCYYGRGGVHACEGLGGAGRAETVATEAGGSGQQQKHGAEYGQGLACARGHEGVVEEYEQENDQEGEFLFHDQKL